jgi:hypothetical protein
MFKEVTVYSVISLLKNSNSTQAIGLLQLAFGREG